MKIASPVFNQAAMMKEKLPPSDNIIYINDEGASQLKIVSLSY
jgi:hypothetical protein